MIRAMEGAAPRTLGARRLAPLSLLALAAACSPAAPPPPRAIPEGPTPTAAPLPAPLAARWVASGGATLVGPVLPGTAGARQGGGAATLVLLGGRRALVHGDGALETEKARSPEPLEEIAEVPAPGGRLRLVGRGAHGVYRFDDPLGPPTPLARLQGRLVRLGAGPGVVAVWTGSEDAPRFLDVESGREQSVAALPAPPLRALTFADERRGAAVVEAVGLAITTDGGATWRLSAESNPGDALRINGLRRTGGDTPGLRAFAYTDGPDGAVDLGGARLGPLEVRHVAHGEPAILRWIHTTGRDPLEVVASGGVDLPTGGALVVSHGLLARVDPRSGAVDELADITRSKWPSPGGLGRSGRTAWIACGIVDDAGRDLFDPFGVIKLSLGEGPLADSRGALAERPVLVRNGEAELRVSPSGGAMLLAPCKGDEPGSACVKQPDGRWRTLSVDTDLFERGAGPLADGRVAFLRGLFDGDEPHDPEAARGGPAPDGGGEGPDRRLHLAAVGLDGKELTLGAVGFTPSRGYVRAQSPIEEDLDHTLRLVFEDGEGALAVAVTPGKEVAQAHPVPDAVVARLRAGRGLAVGGGRVLASLDGGGTWNDVPAPPAALDAARQAAAGYEDPSELSISEMGAKVGSMLRLGWGPAEATAEPPREPEAPLLAAIRVAPSGPEQVLTCTSQGPASSAAPLEGSAQIRELLGGKPAKPGDPPGKKPGARRESSIWSGSRAGMLDTVALFEEEGPEDRGASPARWAFRWHDPLEIGARVRTASTPAPAGAAWSSSLRFAASSGGRALFAVRSGGKSRLIRVKAGGGVEIVEIPSDLVPSGEVAFGEGKSEAIAWLRETQVLVWLPGERPRAIARLGLHGTRTLGAPTAAGVPLLVGGPDWSLHRTLPVASLAGGLAKGAVDPPPAVPSLDGWTHLPPQGDRLTTLPACTGKAASAGERYRFVRPGLRVEIDKLSERAPAAVYEVQIEGASSCLAGLAATLTPDPRVQAPAGPSPAAFVRVDLAGKRAEGGDRGPSAKGVRRMTCSLRTR